MADTARQLHPSRHAEIVPGDVPDCAALLREARQAASLSLRELAARAGTSHSALVAYESGAKVPSVKTFLRVLHASEFAVDIVKHRRVRFRNAMARGEELQQVLELAEHFPNRYAKRKTALEFPRFPSLPRDLPSDSPSIARK